MEILSLDTLQVVRSVTDELNLSHIPSFHYSSQNQLLILNRQKSKILKIYETDRELTKFDNQFLLESIETDDISPMLEHDKKNLLFVGGINQLIVIDLPCKQIIARFCLKGSVTAMNFTKDGSGILVLGKAEDVDIDTYENYFHKIYFNNIKHEILGDGSLKGITTICLDTSDSDNIILAHEGGRSISRFSICLDNLLDDEICFLESPA